MNLPARPAPATGVDVHAHYFGADLAELLPDDSDPRWPHLVMAEDGGGTLLLGDAPFRTVRSALWDVDERIRELDDGGIAVQVISPVPVTLAYWASRDAGIGYARASNESISRAVARSRGRLAGLGTVPLPHIDAAVEELRHAVEDLGLHGVEIGTRIADLDLDAPELEPFFAAASDLRAAVFVHPTEGGGNVVRRGGQPYDFGLGMTTDTAIAATALVFGGVLDRHPDLRIALAHGCGTFPWAYPRLRLAGRIWHGADAAHLDELVSRLWVDSLVFDPAHAPLLVERFGPGHIMLGSDYPFLPFRLDGTREMFLEAERAGTIARGLTDLVHRDNGAAFLGLTSAGAGAVSADAGGSGVHR